MEEVKRFLPRELILELYSVLDELGRDSSFSITAKYFIMRNLHALGPERASIMKAVALPDPLAEYNRCREQICHKYSQKDENGNPVISPEGNFVIDPTKADLFNAEVEKLKEKYSENGNDPSDALLDHINRTKEFLGEEVEVPLVFWEANVKEHSKDLEKLTARQLTVLHPVLGLSGLE